MEDTYLIKDFEKVYNFFVDKPMDEKNTLQITKFFKNREYKKDFIDYEGKKLGIKRFYDSKDNSVFKYIGQFENNAPSGKGIMIFSDKYEVYVGIFSNSFFENEIAKLKKKKTCGSSCDCCH